MTPTLENPMGITVSLLLDPTRLEELPPLIQFVSTILPLPGQADTIQLLT